MRCFGRLSMSQGLAMLMSRMTRRHMALQARKDGDMRNIERRAVNARYLAELVKFRSMPFGVFFVLLKVCAVVYISIDLACMLATGAHPGSQNF